MKINIKIWFSFVMGAVFTALLFMLLLPQYSDYTDAAKTQRWLHQFEISQLKTDIEQRLLAASDVIETTIKSDEHTLYVKSSGMVVMQGNEISQVLLLEPIIKDSSVIWNCMGGSNKHIAPTCKNKSSLE